MEISQKTIKLPYDSAIPLLSIHLKKKNKPTPTYIADVFTNTKTWKQPQWTSTDEWIKNMSHTHTHTGILLSYKKNGIPPFAATWIDLEDFMLSEMLEKEKYPIISLVRGI